MEAATLPILRDQLHDRRRKLEAAVQSPYGAGEAARLLREVDTALQRMAAGTFGLCDVCGEPVEADRLDVDPLTQFCLDHLTPPEQRALERDLELAARIQRDLLPATDLQLDGWQVAYRYEPLGPVSGDYCDLITTDGIVHFLLGDVAGKGIAAALLMSHLSALLRTLVALGLPMTDLVQRANRMFCESTQPAHYATLVCARAWSSGSKSAMPVIPRHW
jgi:sigma-B regulation protein RsbU (phosphoserine phosphatase)